MSHMVIFQTPDGSPGYHQADELEDAIGFVETLRNDQEVEQARIFRMEEVPFEFRGYYRVEIKGNEATPEPSSSATDAPVVVESPAEPEDESGANGASTEALHPMRRMDLLGARSDEDEDEDEDETIEADERVEPVTGLSAAMAVADDEPALASAALGRRGGLFGR